MTRDGTSLTRSERHALRLLARDRRGATEALMIACGFRRKTLAGLVLAGLVTVVTETMRAGGATVRVERYCITERGQEALARER
jgi:hypothetical protein